MKNRLAVFIAGVLAIGASSCSSVSTIRGGTHEPRKYGHNTEAMVEMAELACERYFHQTPEKTEQAPGSYHLFVNNNNFWAGDTDVNISITPTPLGGSEVNFESHGAGFNQPLWNRSANDLHGFFRALDQVVKLRGDTAPGHVLGTKFKTKEERIEEIRLLLENGSITREEHDRAISSILLHGDSSQENQGGG